MIALGAWQWMRFQEKKQYETLLETRFVLPPLSATTLSKDGTSLFRRVTLKGHFLHAHEKHLQARVDKGKPGVRVITPFQLENGQSLIVDRGWSSVTGLTLLDRTHKAIQMVGLVLPLQKKNVFTPQNDPQKNTWYTLEPASMYKDVSFKELYVRQVEEGISQRDVLDTLIALSSWRHLGYMATWWGLAVILFLWVFVTIWRSNNPV